MFLLRCGSVFAWLAAGCLAQSGDGSAGRVFRAPGGTLVLARPAAPVSFGFQDGKERILVEVDGEHVLATVNGALLPAGRLRQAAGQIEVLDAAGAVAACITLAPSGGTLQTFPDRNRVSLGVRLLPAGKYGAAPSGRNVPELRLVAAVIPGMGAEAAGLRAGDLLFEVDGGPVGEARLRELLATKKHGDRVAVRVFRQDAEVACDVELRRPAAGPAPTPAPSMPIELRDGMLVVLGSGDRGAPPGSGAPRDPGAAVAKELQDLRDRLQRVEALLLQLAAPREEGSKK